jgi:FkbM family methyltransferase
LYTLTVMGSTKEYLTDSVTRAAGYVSRTILPRGRGRVAHLTMRYGPRRELAYTDQWGYRRTALLTDRMEAYGFTGYTVLPRAVARRIRPGDWAIDAGANVGRVTAHLCHLVGPRGRVWAIEPLPHNAARLRGLKEQNSLDYLMIYEGGLSSSAGRADLRLPEGGDSAFASFTKSSGMAGALSVATWPLDSLVYAPGTGTGEGRRVAFLKLDVEGYEPQALLGAERTLREMRPLVFCELNDILLREAGSSSAALLRQFASLGYAPVRPLPPLEGRVLDALLAARTPQLL